MPAATRQAAASPASTTTALRPRCGRAPRAGHADRAATGDGDVKRTRGARLGISSLRRHYPDQVRRSAASCRPLSPVSRAPVVGPYGRASMTAARASRHRPAVPGLRRPAARMAACSAARRRRPDPAARPLARRRRTDRGGRRVPDGGGRGRRAVHPQRPPGPGGGLPRRRRARRPGRRVARRRAARRRAGPHRRPLDARAGAGRRRAGRSRRRLPRRRPRARDADQARPPRRRPRLRRLRRAHGRRSRGSRSAASTRATSTRCWIRERSGSWWYGRSPPPTIPRRPPEPWSSALARHARKRRPGATASEPPRPGVRRETNGREAMARGYAQGARARRRAPRRAGADQARREAVADRGFGDPRGHRRASRT